MDFLKEEMHIVWTEVEGTAAKTLVDCLTSSPVLALPDFNKSFFLATDGSDRVVGVMLSQQTKNSETHHIIAWYSSLLHTEGVEVP